LRGVIERASSHARVWSDGGNRRMAEPHPWIVSFP
jgi:hypothetical protein